MNQEEKQRISAFRVKESGSALVEFCLLLPVLVPMIFGVIDFGRFIQARLTVTNLSREGGSLASRDITPGADFNALIAMLQSSAALSGFNKTEGELGRIYIIRIKAGTSIDPDPVILSKFSGGGLAVPSAIGSAGDHPGGLTDAIYNYLVYDSDQKTADIGELTVVEVFYKYVPVTPLPQFMNNILLKDGDGTVIGSRAVF